jgi:ppGpp synthetase/RelA/SpoT-type nucleotidyltranferase
MIKKDNVGGGAGEKTLIKNMSFDDIVYSITKALKEKTYLKENDAYYFDIDTPSASSIYWRGNLSEDKQWSINYDLAYPNFVYLSIEDKRFRAGNIDDLLATIKIDDNISSRYYTNGFSGLDIRNKLYFVYRDKMRKWNKDLDKLAGGGGVGVDSLLDQRKELLEELINSDIIDEEHGYYDDVKGAIQSNDSEQMREIIDELLSSGFIYKDDWDYKLARKLSKEGKKFDLGGGVDDSDDYGTFEIYKNGGSIEVNVVNSDKRYDEKEYDWILGDKDKDGVANADDTKPLDKKNNELIDTPSITTGIKSLISLKKSLDSTMFSFIDDLKNVAPDNSKIYARTKTPYSVLDKLIKKRLSTITDLIGTTIVTGDKKELDSVKKYIDSGKLGKVIELEDMYKNPKGGYRAYHYLIERNGMSIELQLKTKRQKALNELSHEPYKLGKINSALLLKITEIANRADEGDNGAIKEYNEFMKQPDIENVFYAEKMGTGGGVDKVKNKTMNKMNKYAVGGEVGNQVSFKGDYGTPRSGIVKEKRGSSYIVATENGDRLVDSYEVISFSDAPIEKKKRFGFFEGGGEIESKILDLQEVINGDFPQFAKDKAKTEIERLKKQLDESKETKAEEKEEDKKGGSEARKPTTRKAPIKKAVAKKVVVKKEVKGDLPKSKFEKGDKVGVSGDNEVYEIKDKSYRNNIEGELTWVYYLPEYSSVLVSEKNLKVVPKPKADHKKLVAKLKAKKGATPSNEPSKGHKRSESSDRKREALPLGKRISADGSVYYENRLNRADMSKEDKFKEGGEIGENNSGWGLKFLKW